MASKHASKPSKKQAEKYDVAMKLLAEAVKQLSCASEGTEVKQGIDANLVAKFPKLKMKVPTIFLHKTVDFATHVKQILALGINFYQPYLSSNYTKIICPTFDDHKALVQYFVKNKLPHHTFGHPEKRKLRIVIRGLPIGTNLNELKEAIKKVGVPVIRVHEMHVKDFAKNRDLVILAVVPHTADGKKMLSIRKILGHAITLEPAIKKTQQCHRCQRWGHSQRYCKGDVKCVKCAGDHWSNKCTRDANVEDPTCANCGGAHTASYRQCFHCPDSVEYLRNRRRSVKEDEAAAPKQIVTADIAENNLYKKIHNIPKHTEAIPF